MPHHFLRAIAVLAVLTAPLPADPAGDWATYIDAGKKAFAAKQFDAAEKHFAAAVKTSEGFGAKDTRLAASLDHLATVYSMKQQYDKAVPLFKRAVAVIEAATDKGHPDLIGTLQSLGLVYRTQNKLDEAEEIYQRVHGIVTATFGKDDERVATSFNNLAALEGLRGQYGKAAALLEQALVIRESKAGAESSGVAATCTDLGNTYFRLNKLDDAEKHYKRALAIIEKTQVGKPAVVDAINKLTQLYDAKKQFAQSLPLNEKALAILEKNLGKDHQAVAGAVTKLATTHAAMEQYDKAEPLFVRALAVQEKTLGKEDVEVGKTCFALGRLYVQMGKFPEAEPYCKRSIAIFQKTVGPKHPFYAFAVLNYAAVMENTGRANEAAKLKQLVEQLQKVKEPEKK